MVVFPTVSVPLVETGYTRALPGEPIKTLESREGISGARRAKWS